MMPLRFYLICPITVFRDTKNQIKEQYALTRSYTPNSSPADISSVIPHAFEQGSLEKVVYADSLRLSSRYDRLFEGCNTMSKHRLFTRLVIIHRKENALPSAERFAPWYNTIPVRDSAHTQQSVLTQQTEPDGR